MYKSICFVYVLTDRRWNVHEIAPLYLVVVHRLDKVHILGFFGGGIITIDDVDLYNYCNIYNKICRFEFAHSYGYCINCDLSESEYYYFINLWNSLSLDVQDFVRKFIHNRNAKKSRIYKRIEFMLNEFSVCYFCTFTLDDEHVNLSLPYLRKKLTTMLSSLNCYYLGNVDYGEKNGRLHFHFIVAQNDVHICKDNVPWGFGWYDLKVIYNKDEKRLGSYIMKLVNHSTKSTTKQNIICSKGCYSFAKLKL